MGRLSMAGGFAVRRIVGTSAVRRSAPGAEESFRNFRKQAGVNPWTADPPRPRPAAAGTAGGAPAPATGQRCARMAALPLAQPQARSLAHFPLGYRRARAPQPFPGRPFDDRAGAP